MDENTTYLFSGKQSRRQSNWYLQGADMKTGHMDIEGCNRFPLSRSNTGGTKRVIVKLWTENTLRYATVKEDHKFP